MSNHVIEWLSAYLDGELKGKQLHQVEEHLAECEACQAELDSLQGLSSLLQEVPEAEVAPAIIENVGRQCGMPMGALEVSDGKIHRGLLIVGLSRCQVHAPLQ